MLVEQLLQSVPVFVLVFFRLAAMMVFAPFFGSGRIPQRVKLPMVLVLAMGMSVSIHPPANLPADAWTLAVGIGGEIAFGLAMGLIVSFVFVSVQWAGEMIGQQMGLNLSEVFDPQFGAQGSVVGEMYFMLTLVIFLAIRGHHALLRAVRSSFESLPLLSLNVDAPLVDLLVGLFGSATMLAFQLAGPMLVAILIADVALGFIGKTMPQMNILSAGMSLRSLLGMVILIVGLVLTTSVIRGALYDALREMATAYGRN